MKRVAAAALVAALLVTGWLARTWLGLQLAVRVVNHRSAERETKLGFAPRLLPMPDGWLPILRTDMDDAWKPLGRRGLNYFSFGAPDTAWSRYASHADPHSPRYQAWFGVYVVELPAGAPVPADAELPALSDELLKHDQLRWLKTMGDPAPSAEVAARESHETVVIDGRTLPLWEGSLTTHSSIGACADGPRIARFIGCPPVVDRFHPIALTGFVAVWADEKRRAVFAVYGNGLTSTWQSMRPGLLELARGVHVD